MSPDTPKPATSSDVCTWKYDMVSPMIGSITEYRVGSRRFTTEAECRRDAKAERPMYETIDGPNAPYLKLRIEWQRNRGDSAIEVVGMYLITWLQEKVTELSGRNCFGCKMDGRGYNVSQSQRDHMGGGCLSTWEEKCLDNISVIDTLFQEDWKEQLKALFFRFPTIPHELDVNVLDHAIKLHHLDKFTRDAFVDLLIDMLGDEDVIPTIWQFRFQDLDLFVPDKRSHLEPTNPQLSQNKDNDKVDNKVATAVGVPPFTSENSNDANDVCDCGAFGLM